MVDGNEDKDRKWIWIFMYFLFFLILIAFSLDNENIYALEVNGQENSLPSINVFPKDHFIMTHSLTPGICVPCQSIIAKSVDLLPIGFLEDGFELQKSIVKITNLYGDDGTGMMISPSLLLTTNHLIDSSIGSMNSVVEYNYQLNILNGTEGKEFAGLIMASTILSVISPSINLNSIFSFTLNSSIIFEFILIYRIIS